MIKYFDKKRFLRQFNEFYKSNFTSFDLACFISQSPLAQFLLGKSKLHDYSKELDFLTSNDLSKVEAILDTPHIRFFDPLKGSKDPLVSFRVSKADMAKCKIREDIIECDNILGHLLRQLEAEPITCELKDILYVPVLEKLTTGEYDNANVSQIYYFKKTTDSGSFFFGHYYRNGDRWERNAFPDHLINDFDKEIDIDKYDSWREAYDAYIATFVNMYKDHCKGIPGTLGVEVYNGMEAISQLRATYVHDFEEIWKRKRQAIIDNGGREAEEERSRLYFMLKDHPQVLTLPCFRSKESFDLAFRSADASTLRTLFDIIKDLAFEIEKRDKCIEQYKKECERLKACQ